MSTTSKVVLGASVSFAIGIISYVHYRQGRDREVLHEGIIKDMDRQTRKQQNIQALAEQRELKKFLEHERERELADQRARRAAST